MKRSRFYYKNLDIIRILACVAVLLYHMNILKGGYLAVCTFFALNGYLTCLSCFKKEKFSFKEYYVNKFKRIYLPLLIVVFISIAVISLFSDINWFNMKPETTSVLLGYNNFWQLGANLDYFARHVSSPFMHLWYIAIILQFDLIFPFIYLIFRKIGDKVSTFIPCFVFVTAAILFGVYFCINSSDQNIMVVYYDTFSRIFSLLFGVGVGFINSYYGQKIFNIYKNTYLKHIIFIFYLIVLIYLYTAIDASSNMFVLAMITTTLISCRLIDYGTISPKENLSIFDKIIKALASITYEVYLVQYPVIFLSQYINVGGIDQNILIIVLTIIISCVLHFALNLKGKIKGLRIFVFVILLAISSYGGYKYYIAKDHTQEMKELELKLLENEKVMQQQQEEYASKLKQEKEDWMATLNELENYEKELYSIVTNLPVVGIGDSVMLGAVPDLQKEFPNGYFDAKVSRTAWVVNGIVTNLKNNNMLGDPVIMNLGANGDCSYECKAEIMKNLGERKVFWLNVTNSDAFNANLLRFAADYDNLYVIDWKSISTGHPEYFYADGIHLTEYGRPAYTKAIYNEIYKVYLDEYNVKKQEILNKHEQEQNNKISFIGNTLLLNAYTSINEYFNDAEFIINKDYTFETIKEEIINRIDNDSLTYRVLLVFDDSIKLTHEQYQELIDLCENNEIYILDINQKLSKLEDNNVIIMDFYREIQSHKNYLMADGKHLTEEGNKALANLINTYIEY